MTSSRHQMQSDPPQGGVMQPKAVTSPQINCMGCKRRKDNMCVIAVSKAGRRQPTEEEIRNMFYHNPHGAGYMFARDGEVIIHKGFMDVEEYIKAVRSEGLTEETPAVYHFRISTQAGVGETMTHPFPLTSRLEDTEVLDCIAQCGVAHNGVISLTTNGNSRYSDTALFITDYLNKLIRNPKDLKDKAIITMISRLTNSKWAIMDASGEIAVIGSPWYVEDGVQFSNHSYEKYETYYYTKPARKTKGAQITFEF